MFSFLRTPSTIHRNIGLVQETLSLPNVTRPTAHDKTVDKSWRYTWRWRGVAWSHWPNRAWVRGPRWWRFVKWLTRYCRNQTQLQPIQAAFTRALSNRPDTQRFAKQMTICDGSRQPMPSLLSFHIMWRNWALSSTLLQKLMFVALLS